ncbi:MAG: hypothetical protein KAS61_08655 [Spirochaetes bacterium]|nr:hypothetical protein [Spirochaetota bacterium]
MSLTILVEPWKKANSIEEASLGEMGDFACRLGALIASRRGAVPQYDQTDIDMLTDSLA